MRYLSFFSIAVLLLVSSLFFFKQKTAYEIEIRKGLLAIILESLSAEALAASMQGADGNGTANGETSSGTIEEFVSRLDLPTYRRILREQLHDRDDDGPMAMVETLFVAIVA